MPRSYAPEVQVVFRKVETCELCGAVDPFVKTRTVKSATGSKMQYARCKKCGASAKIYYT